MKRINYDDPTWPDQIRRRQQALKERRQGLAAARDAVKKVRSRHYRLSLDTLGAVHNAQNGKCANRQCLVPIKTTGRGRVLDEGTNKMLCKRCAIMLSIGMRDVKRLAGLISYLSEIKK